MSSTPSPDLTTDLSGTWFVSPTPFTADGAVDPAGLAGIVDATADWGVDGITVLGVMGEVSALSDAERDEVLTGVLRAAAGRIPVAVGCSSPSAPLTAQRISRAVELGASAVMVSAPTLLKDTDQIAGFYRAACGGAGVPVIVQDEPAATGVPLPVSALLAALDATASTTVKLEDPPTPPKITRLLAARPGLTVFGGLGGVSAYAELRRGASGTMTGFAFPEVLRGLRLAAAAGDFASAAVLFDRYLPYLTFEGQPVVGLGIRKEVLRRRGVITCARTRNLRPFLDEITLAELDDVLRRVDLTPVRAALVVSA
ncbi:dihydrodipicolinate synthase family protein [Nakamurella sp. PAMC28650]|uniref:dihydrodipicolinate synthase family protein n=1 Tax=Nakamurella sp. PAMC28650 TaxID=2762325 RepID=UPI00164E2A29|nr:dihydrodipicolinate synthase family protein [Nakamurella sp. PAMC28650]QNK82149.1 dihydrodipicolinate synthase family protein [Nakamurella sp. PAMC28650]